MKKNSLFIMSITVILYLLFAVTSTSAAPKQRYHGPPRHREVRKVRVLSNNKRDRQLSTRNQQNRGYWGLKRIRVAPTHKRVNIHSQRHRPQGHWKVRKVWVPPTPRYKRVMIPVYYNPWATQMITQWIRIADRPGYWAKTRIWVTNGHGYGY